MDLIDRGAAIEAMKKWATQPVIMKSRYFDPKGKAIVLDMIGTVEGQPSVPAVPLDKLCKWLAVCTDDPPCISLRGYDCGIVCREKKPSDAECWETVITKWMEGLHAAD